jgi:hypothetical protein
MEELGRTLSVAQNFFFKGRIFGAIIKQVTGQKTIPKNNIFVKESGPNKPTNIPN